jgi:hypothetical protein
MLTSLRVVGLQSLPSLQSSSLCYCCCCSCRRRRPAAAAVTATAAAIVAAVAMVVVVLPLLLPAPVLGTCSCSSGPAGTCSCPASSCSHLPSSCRCCCPLSFLAPPAPVLVHLVLLALVPALPVLVLTRRRPAAAAARLSLAPPVYVLVHLVLALVLACRFLFSLPQPLVCVCIRYKVSIYMDNWLTYL